MGDNEESSLKTASVITNFKEVMNLDQHSSKSSSYIYVAFILVWVSYLIKYSIKG